jgi:hypothetical protein
MLEEIMATGLILCGRKGGNNFDESRQSRKCTMVANTPQLDIVSLGQWQIYRGRTFAFAQRVIEECPMFTEFAFAAVNKYPRFDNIFLFSGHFGSTQNVRHSILFVRTKELINNVRVGLFVKACAMQDVRFVTM